MNFERWNLYTQSLPVSTHIIVNTCILTGVSLGKGSCSVGLSYHLSVHAVANKESWNFQSQHTSVWTAQCSRDVWSSVHAMKGGERWIAYWSSPLLLEVSHQCSHSTVSSLGRHLFNHSRKYYWPGPSASSLPLLPTHSFSILPGHISGHCGTAWQLQHTVSSLTMHLAWAFLFTAAAEQPTPADRDGGVAEHKLLCIIAALGWRLCCDFIFYSDF